MTGGIHMYMENEHYGICDENRPNLLKVFYVRDIMCMVRRMTYWHQMHFLGR